MIDPKEIRAGNWVIKITGRDIHTQSVFEYRAIASDDTITHLQGFAFLSK
jgi:hypothetical protein